MKPPGSCVSRLAGIASPRSDVSFSPLDFDRFLGGATEFFEKPVELIDPDVEGPVALRSAVTSLRSMIHWRPRCR